MNQVPTDRRELLNLLGQKDRNIYFRASMKEFQTVMDAHAPRSWQILAPNAIVAGTPCQLYSMVNQELWHISKNKGEYKGIGAWKPLPNEELDEFISIVFACRKYVDLVIHEVRPLQQPNLPLSVCLCPSTLFLIGILCRTSQVS